MLKIIYGLMLIYLLTTEASTVAEKPISNSSSTTTSNTTTKTTNQSQSSILSSITSDQNVCPTSSLMKTSKYTQVCGNLTVPTQMEVTDQTIDQFLCLAVWHRAVKLCHLSSTKTKSVQFPPPEQEKFDAEVENFLTKEPDFDVLGKICKHWKTVETFKYEKTQKYLDNLSSVLKKPKMCLDLCVDKENKLKGLCVFVYFIDQFIDDEINGVGKKEVKTQEVNEKKKEEVEVKVKEERGGKEEDKDVNVKGKEIEEKEKVVDDKEQKVDGNGKEGGTGTGTGDKDKDKDVKVEEKIEGGKSEKSEVKDSEVKQSELIVEKNDNVMEQIPTANEDAFPSEINDNNVFPTDPDTANDDGDDIDVETEGKGPVKQEDNDKESEGVVPRLSNMPKEDDDSHFFGYLSILGLIFGMGGCVLYHHKQKVLAILLEGRRSRGGRGRRRPSTANYRKLDCTLEEAVTSQCNSNATNVIY